jgi:hypothetical protein
MLTLMSITTSLHIRRADVLRLAAEIGIDPRTAQRALEHGPDALRAIADRERARDAIARLGLRVGSAKAA